MYGRWKSAIQDNATPLRTSESRLDDSPKRTTSPQHNAPLRYIYWLRQATDELNASFDLAMLTNSPSIR
jgi:hypothetical protein